MGPGFPRCWRIGRAKAAVLPVPVWAEPMISFPERATGMAWAWMGVGSLYPRSTTAWRTEEESPKEAKSIEDASLPRWGGASGTPDNTMDAGGRVF